MEVQEFLNSSNHEYCCDLVYTRTFVGGGGATAAVEIFLRQGKPTPQKETFVGLLTHEVNVSPSILPTQSQVLAEQEKMIAQKKLRRMAAKDIVALIYAKNFGVLHSIRPNLVVKYLKKADLTDVVYQKYLERREKETEAVSVPIQKATHPIHALTMEDLVDFDEEDEEAMNDYQDHERSLRSQLGEYYYSDIVELAMKGARPRKAILCIHQKFACTAKRVGDCLAFLKTLSVGETMFAQSMHSRAMNICSMVLDEVKPFLADSPTLLLGEKSQCYSLFCSLTKDLVLLDDAIVKLGLAPDELARAPGPVALAVGYTKIPEDTNAITHCLGKRTAKVERLERRLKCLAMMESPPTQLDGAKTILVETKRLIQHVRRRSAQIQSHPSSVWEEDPSQWEYEMSLLMDDSNEIDTEIARLRMWCDRQA